MEYCFRLAVLATNLLLPSSRTVLCKVGTGVHLTQEGEIKVDAVSPQNVIVNCGTKSVARVDNTVDGGILLLVAPMGVLASAQYLPPGTPLPSTLSTGAIVVKLNGKITSGTEHFKG